MPRGHFFLKDHESRPLVMAAAGIGLTPILSMIDFIASSANDNPNQVVICLQVEQSPEEHSVKEHIDDLAGKKLLTQTHVFYTRHSGEGVALQNTTVHTGRPCTKALKNILGDVLQEAEFYFCGPLGVMDGFGAMLDDLEVDKNRRHSERFGPEL